MSDWQPIETAPIKPFDKDNWYMPHCPSLLLCGVQGFIYIGSYGFTKGGKGRWKSNGHLCYPRFWQNLPKPPAAQETTHE